MSAKSTWRIFCAIGLVALTLAAAGCAGRAGNAEQTRTSLPADCILVRTISDYDALDGDDLVIHGPGNTAYHVVLRTPSLGIEGEFRIEVFDDGDGRLCPYGRDSVIIDGPVLEEIRIRSIESIDPAELEALRVQFGEAEGATVEPEQVL